MSGEIEILREIPAMKQRRSWDWTSPEAKHVSTDGYCRVRVGEGHDLRRPVESTVGRKDTPDPHTPRALSSTFDLFIDPASGRKASSASTEALCTVVNAGTSWQQSTSRFNTPLLEPIGIDSPPNVEEASSTARTTLFSEADTLSSNLLAIHGRAEPFECAAQLDMTARPEDPIHSPQSLPASSAASPSRSIVAPPPASLPIDSSSHTQDSLPLVPFVPPTLGTTLPKLPRTKLVPHLASLPRNQAVTFDLNGLKAKTGGYTEPCIRDLRTCMHQASEGGKCPQCAIDADNPAGRRVFPRLHFPEGLVWAER